MSHTPPSNLGGSLYSNSLTSSNVSHPADASQPPVNIDVGLNNVSGQLPILFPSLPLMSETHPYGIAPHNCEEESHRDQQSAEDEAKSDNEYVPDSDGHESCDDSDDVTPQPLEGESGENNYTTNDADGVVGGGYMGEGDYVVEEFSVQQLITHLLGQHIDKQNRFNVEIRLFLRLVCA